MNWNSQIPRFVVKTNGATYGAYLTLDHAKEIKERLGKKGYLNITIVENAMEWVYPEGGDTGIKK